MTHYDKAAPFSAVSEHNRIELFKQAKEYFEKNPEIQKLSRQDTIPSITIPIDNSMIKIDGAPGLLMLSANKECNIIGAGASGRVKFGMDEAGKLYAVKIATERKAPLSLNRSLSDDEFDEDKPQALPLSSTHRTLIDEHKTLLNLKQGSRYLVKDSGTSQSPKSTRQRAKLRALAVLVPLILSPLRDSKSTLPNEYRHFIK